MPSKPQAERLYYSFNPNPGMLKNLAKPSGPRPTLLSAYYLIGLNGKNITKGLKRLEEWAKYAHPYPIMIDSGIYSIRASYGFGVKQSQKLTGTDKQARDELLAKGLAQKDVLDNYVDAYCEFLKQAEGMWDSAVEFDADHFLGLEITDQYYEKLVTAVGPKRIMRVFHQMYRKFEDWVEWMENPDTEFHCLEGGTTHKRDPDYYRTFIHYAHKHGKRVHVLALTVPEFMQKVPVDTVDSSTFVNGGRFGSIKVPGLGEVTFSSATDLTKETAATAKHYTKLGEAEFNLCMEWFNKHGYTLEQVLTDHYVRSILNIFYHDEVVDVPYKPQPKSKNLFLQEYI